MCTQYPSQSIGAGRRYHFQDFKSYLFCLTVRLRGSLPMLECHISVAVGELSYHLYRLYQVFMNRLTRTRAVQVFIHGRVPRRLPLLRSPCSGCSSGPSRLTINCRVVCLFGVVRHMFVNNLCYPTQDRTELRTSKRPRLLAKFSDRPRCFILRICLPSSDKSNDNLLPVMHVMSQ